MEENSTSRGNNANLPFLFPKPPRFAAFSASGPLCPSLFLSAAWFQPLSGSLCSHRFRFPFGFSASRPSCSGFQLQQQDSSWKLVKNST